MTAACPRCGRIVEAVNLTGRGSSFFQLLDHERLSGGAICPGTGELVPAHVICHTDRKAEVIAGHFAAAPASAADALAYADTADRTRATVLDIGHGVAIAITVGKSPSRLVYTLGCGGAGQRGTLDLSTFSTELVAEVLADICRFAVAAARREPVE